MGKRQKTLDARGCSDSSPVRVEDLGRHSHVSQSGIENLIRAIKEVGMPECSSRREQYRERKRLCATQTAHGPILETESLQCTKPGDEIVIGYQNPQAWMAYNAQHSTCFCEVVTNALQTYPNSPLSPWCIVVYQDGVDPSDGLAKNHSRKSAVFYWSVLQYGMHALSKEEMWGTLTIVRTLDSYKLESQVAQVASKALRRFHIEGRDVAVNGVTLEFKTGGSTTVFMKIGVILADEPALKEFLECKGHAGLMPCALCSNATLHRGFEGGKSLWELDNRLVLRKLIMISFTNAPSKIFVKPWRESTQSKGRNDCRRLRGDLESTRV